MSARAEGGQALAERTSPSTAEASSSSAATSRRRLSAREVGETAPAASLDELVRSARLGIWIVIVAVIVFTLADLRATTVPAAVVLIKSLQLAVAAIALVALGRASRADQAAHMLVGCGTALCLLTVAYGVASGDLGRTIILCLTLTWGAAALLPWSGSMQLRLAAVTFATCLIGAWTAGKLRVLGFTGVSTGTAFFLSVWLSEQRHRQRRALAAAHDERRRAHQRLERSAEDFRSIIDSFDDVFFRVRLDRTIEMVSRSVERYGYRVEELIGSKASFFYADPELHDRTLARLLSEGSLRDVELPLLAKDGRIVMTSQNVQLRFDDGGRPIAFEGTLRDITERKRAEDELRRAHELLERDARQQRAALLEELRLVTDNMFDMVSRVSLLGVHEYVSPAHERVLGYRREELLGQSVLALVHPEDLAAVTASIVTGAQTGTGRIEFRARHADGHYLWLETIGKALKDEQGAITGFVMSARDITERKRAEEASQLAHQRLSHVVAASPVMLYSVKLTGGRLGSVWVSENFERLTGYPYERYGQEWWSERVHPDDLDQLQPLESFLSQGDSINEYRFRRADGSYMWIRNQARIIRDAEGASIEMIGSWADVTEQKQAVEALQRSERRFRILTEKSPDLVSILARDGTYRYVNAAHLALGDGEAASLVGRSAFEFLHPEDARLLMPRLQAALESGEMMSTIDYRLRYRDGSWHDFAGIALNLLDDPDIDGILITGRDVTERKWAEERAALLLEFAEDIRDTYDTETLLDRVQRRTARVLRCSGVTVSRWDADVDAFLHIADLGISAEFQAALRATRFAADEPFGGRLSSGETILLNSAAEAPPLLRPMAERFGVSSMIIAPLRIQGRHLGSLAALRFDGSRFESNHVDLCTAIAGQTAIAMEAIELQRRRQEEAAVSAALARVGHEMISSLDDRELLDRLCAVTAEVLGCDVSYAVVWVPEDGLYHILAAHGGEPEDREEARALKLPAEGMVTLIDELKVKGVTQVETATARTFWGAAPARYGVTIVLNVPLRRGDEIIGVLAAGLRHRTGRFSALQERIACGISELASVGLENARLVQKLEQANRLKSEFLATISHELRTPLGVITGYTDLMLEGVFGELRSEQSDAMRRVRKNASELLDLISATLDVSRLESGRMPLNLAPTALTPLLREIESESREMQEQSGLQFVWGIPDQLPELNTDAVKLKVVLKNLIGNAVKFTPAGSVTVDATVGDSDVEIAVRDTGIGIAPEILPVIFEPFRQGDSSNTRRYGGVGLGLYIVRSLLDVLGGSVSVDSEVGRGTAFRVHLPLSGTRALSPSPS